jgi:chromosome segregation ATPase
VLWVARLRGALDGESLVELLLFAFPPRLKGRSKRVQTAKPDLGPIVARLLHKKAARDTVLAVVTYHVGKAADATEASRALAAKLERLQQDITLHEQTIDSLKGQAAKDQHSLKEKEESIARLSQDITDHKAVARQARQRLMARLNGLLQGELLPMLRDVHDSSTMQPVRTHIILDRIETARKLIEKESQWLESSD